jgi:hypothetical protein
MKPQDFKSRDGSLLKNNFSGFSVVDRQKKISVFPPNLKFGANGVKADVKEFKKIKSLSPVLLENVEPLKENLKLNTTFIKLKLELNNQQDNEDLAFNSKEVLKDIQEKVEKFEKKFGSSLSNSKIREYLCVFDDFSKGFKEFKFFLSRFKRIFEQVYLRSIVLMNEVQELRLVSKKKLESFGDFQYFHEKELLKVASEESAIKKPFAQKISYVSKKNLLQEEEFSLPRQKSSEYLEGRMKREQVKKMVPKLLVADKIEGVVDFQDEFMANLDEFSESWRVLVEKQKRFE